MGYLYRIGPLGLLVDRTACGLFDWIEQLTARQWLYYMIIPGVDFTWFSALWPVRSLGGCRTARQAVVLLRHWWLTSWLGLYWYSVGLRILYISCRLIGIVPIQLTALLYS